MKKYILVVLGVFLCVSGAVAENIESVSFNPARLGRFERLKVSDTLSTKGALQTDAATINGNSSGVTIDNAGNYVITTTKANSKVELPNATLTPGTLNLYGGTATFSAASEVETMEQSGDVPADVKAATLAMTGHAITVTNGLTLGPNRIPVPGNCSGLGWYHLSTSDEHQRFSVLGCGETSGGSSGGGSDCSDATYAAAHAQECCVAKGFTWQNGACKRSCTAYVAKATIKHCDAPSCRTLYSGTGQTSGSCSDGIYEYWNTDTGGLLAKVNNGVCDTDESYPATSGGIGLAEYLGLDCETQFGERNSATTLSCAYYATSNGTWPTPQGPFCTAGTLTCEYAKKTWYCNSSQSCGEEENECR